jgi:ribonuclease VapC
LIIDTSALVAILMAEPGFEIIAAALARSSSECRIPAPVIVELHRVTSDVRNQPSGEALKLVESIIRAGGQITPFDADMAACSNQANARYGSGNGKGGRLNILDLMVYATAKSLDLPILCTGSDFSSTDAEIHPASRIG